MKILFVTNEVPYPPDNGVRIVSHNFMRLMHEAGHQLGLAVLTDDLLHAEQHFSQAALFCGQDRAWWVPLRYRKRHELLVTAALKNKLVFIERYYSNQFRLRLSHFIKEFNPDVIHFDLIPMTQYIDLVPPTIGTVASINDSWALALEDGLRSSKYNGAERAYRTYEHYRVRSYERTTYPKFSVTHVVSESDKQYLTRLNTNIRATVVSNGVNQVLFGIAGATLGQINMLFLGKLSGDNLHCLLQFLKKSWPIVRTHLPQAKLHIVGAIGREGQVVKELADSDSGLVLRGYVSDLGDVYAECGIAVIPILKSCGILNKAIEAMAAGLVAVGFKNSFAGIPEAQNKVHFLAANDYEAMGYCLIDAVQNGTMRSAIQRNAHSLARKYYSWQDRLPKLEAMYSLARQQCQEQITSNYEGPESRS